MRYKKLLYLKAGIFLLMPILSSFAQELHSQDNTNTEWLVVQDIFKQSFQMDSIDPIISIKEIETDVMNQYFLKAQKEKKPWTQNLSQIPFHLPEINLEKELDYSAEGSPSQSVTVKRYVVSAAEEVKITVEENGYGDDSIAGQRYVLLLKKDKNFYVIKRLLWAQHCSRPCSSFISGGLCP